MSTTETSELASPAPVSPFEGWRASHCWTLDDLDRFPEDGRRYEIIDGSLRVSPSSTVAHQVCVGWLLVALHKSAPGGCFAIPGMVDVLLAAEPTRLLVPDVVAADGIDVEAELRYLEPVDLRLVVEVVSSDSIVHDRFTKPVLYAEAGIPTYWRVELDDDGPTVHVHHLTVPAESGDAKYIEVCAIRPGATVTLEKPWPVTLIPPQYASR